MERSKRSDRGEQVPTEPVQTSGEGKRVEQTSAFRELVQRKKAFLIPAAIFSFVLIMSWPVLAGLSTVLDGQAIGAMPWAYVYGFALFPAALILLHLYVRQAKKWDRLAEEARREASEGRTVA